MSTLFVLGREVDLSVAELHAFFPQALILHLSDTFLWMEPGQKIDQKVFNQLGGVLKVAEIHRQVEKKDLNEGILELLLKDHDSGKLNYGLSVYGMPEPALRPLLLDLKKLLKSAAVSSRFANQDFKNLSIAQKKGLKGPEILVAKIGAEFVVGKVIATQDIDAYSRRDYHKPFRDMKVGMLPPKLAQILINLTGSKGPIWDPFCGGGVLLMEGLLMGYDMLGSDIDGQTLEGARKNVSWVQSQFGLKTKSDLFLHDATDPLPDKKIDAIAFEGYLGPVQTRLRSEKELRPIISSLDQLYLHFFSALKRAQFKGPIVIALPFFKTKEGSVSLHCIEKIKEMGFKADILLPEKNLDHLKYARTDQFVGREIYRFRLNI